MVLNKWSLGGHARFLFLQIDFKVTKACVAFTILALVSSTCFAYDKWKCQTSFMPPIIGVSYCRLIFMVLAYTVLICSHNCRSVQRAFILVCTSLRLQGRRKMSSARTRSSRMLHYTLVVQFFLLPVCISTCISVQLYLQ